MIELRTLGPLDLRDPDGREVRSVLAQPKRLALLTYLAVGVPDGFARRDTLLGMFWPESSDERARGALRQAVLYLRRSLGEEVLVNRAEDELGIAGGAIRCDATEFRAALGRGDDATALSLYRGDLLDGFFVTDAPGFERWLEDERGALKNEATAAAWRLADAATEAGEVAVALDWAGRGVDLAPMDEAGVRRRMALLASTGDRAGAVGAYRDFAQRLAEELELEPASATRALVDEIRRHETGVAAPEGRSTAADPPQPLLPGRPSIGPGMATRTSDPRRIAVTGAVAILAITAMAYLALPRGAEPSLEPRHVLVMPFENRTGDAELEPVANMAADWIVQGLAGRGALQVVPVRTVLVLRPHLAREADGASGAELDPRRVALETGAGTAVTGSYYLQGEALHFQAQITDVTTARVITAVGPISSSVASPLEGIDQLRDRVLDALAPLSDERDTHVRVAQAPPSYDAYRAYVSGFESFVAHDVPGALRSFERAIAADSTFALAAIAAAIAHYNVGRWAATDSIVSRLAASRDELGPMELATLDMVGGWLRGDDHAAYEATLRQARLAPGSIGEYQVAEQARRLNRPGETIRVLTGMGAERGELRGWIEYWRELTTANHMLGNHRAELKAARRSRDLYPGRPQAVLHEVTALAALGRVADVDRRIQELPAVPSQEWPSAGMIMLTAARELRAHGRSDAATVLLHRCLEWYRALPPGGPIPDPRIGIAITLYELGDWDAAQDAFAVLAGEAPRNVGLQGYLGALAARRGDRAEAERVDGWLRDLERPYLMGHHTLWRARIAALAGDEDRAVELLRIATAQGVQHGTQFHTQIDFEALRDHPGFRELLRPKG